MTNNNEVVSNEVENSQGKKFNKNILANIIPFLGLIVVVAFFAIMTGGTSIAFRNLKLIAMQSAILIIGSTGVMFTISHGSLDFSMGGVAALAGLVAGLLGSINPWLAIPGAIIGGLAGQWFVVGVHFALKIPTFIVSLATMFITRGLVSAITQSRQVLTPSIFNVVDTPAFYYIMLAVVLIIGFIIFEYTKIGKYNKAIGSNYDAAITSGVPVKKFKFIAFTIAGVALAICGFLSMLRAGGVSAAQGQGFELNIIISLVLGGISLTGGTSVRLRSVIVGCLILTMLENGLVIMGVEPAIVGAIKGGVFLAAVALSFDRKTGKIVV